MGGDIIAYVIGGIGALVVVANSVNTWIKFKHDEKWRGPFEDLSKEVATHRTEVKDEMIVLRADITDRIHELDRRLSVVEGSLPHVASQLDEIKKRMETDFNMHDKDIANLYDKISKLTDTLMDLIRQ